MGSERTDPGRADRVESRRDRYLNASCMYVMRFCTSCGGQLVARGDGKLACVRCGAVY